jgi:hypothetical protein
MVRNDSRDRFLPDQTTAAPGVTGTVNAAEQTVTINVPAGAGRDRRMVVDEP